MTFAERPRARQSAYLSADEVLVDRSRRRCGGLHGGAVHARRQAGLRYRAARKALNVSRHKIIIVIFRRLRARVARDRTAPTCQSRNYEPVLDRRLADMSPPARGSCWNPPARCLCEPGGVHHGPPDKRPEVRLETLRLAGELRVPFTTGILIGIGETGAERLEALFAIRDLHREFGHMRMGVDFADYNNDGWPDLVITDLANQRYALYENAGDGTFNYATSTSGLGEITLLHSGWSLRFIDYDNDGWKDLLIAQGHDLDTIEKSYPLLHYREPMMLVRNTGRKFADVIDHLIQHIPRRLGGPRHGDRRYR